MTQTAFLQNNTAMQLLGLVAGSGAGAEGLGQGVKFGQNGGLSFQALLMINPEQMAEGSAAKNALLTQQQALQNAKSGAAMPALLKLQAVNADGAPEQLMTLAERLAANIESMFAPQSGQGKGAELTALNNGDGNASADILFMFNAPIALNNKSMVLSEINALNQSNNVQNGNIIKQIQDGSLSADTVFALMMQDEAAGQNGKNPAQSLNTLFSEMLSANGNSAEMQEQLKSLQDDFYAGLTGFFMQLDSANPMATGQAAGANGDAKAMQFALLTPFKGNFQAGQNPFNSSDNTANNNANFKAAFISLNQPAGAKAAQSGTTANGFADVMSEADSAETKSALNGLVAGMNKGNGLKPQLLGSSALTPAQISGGAAANNAAASANNAMSFTNMFAFGEGEQLSQAQLEQLPEFEHAIIKADLQSPASKANTMVFAKQAGTPHPTSQTVAQQINFMARQSGNGNSEMRMRLDPPELGNLSIALKFGKDNTVKAHLTVERPETLAMLQKDSASLQKALEDAGLDVNSDSLSFDLQGQGSGDATGQNDDRGNNNFNLGGKNQNAGTGEGQDLDENLIETQMTVFIDPHTGQQRVNMMV